MGNLFVTNKNDFVHEDRYDGEDYRFPPNERILISTDAATHFFGWNLVDKTDTLVRLGWATRYDPAAKNFIEDAEGVKKLARFVFEEAVTVPKSQNQRQPEIA
jgi:hypothetical protein